MTPAWLDEATQTVDTLPYIVVARLGVSDQPLSLIGKEPDRESAIATARRTRRPYTTDIMRWDAVDKDFRYVTWLFTGRK